VGGAAACASAQPVAVVAPVDEGVRCGVGSSKSRPVGMVVLRRGLGQLTRCARLDDHPRWWFRWGRRPTGWSLMGMAWTVARAPVSNGGGLARRGREQHGGTGLRLWPPVRARHSSQELVRTGEGWRRCLVPAGGVGREVTGICRKCWASRLQITARGDKVVTRRGAALGMDTVWEKKAGMWAGCCSSSQGKRSH
jgi:hypothetical protein